MDWQLGYNFTVSAALLLQVLVNRDLRSRIRMLEKELEKEKKA